MAGIILGFLAFTIASFGYAMGQTKLGLASLLFSGGVLFTVSVMAILPH